MPTGCNVVPTPGGDPGTRVFEPSAALAFLDEIQQSGAAPETGSAWDAAWIACLTGSPRWAEAARLEFTRIAGPLRRSDTL